VRIDRLDSPDTQVPDRQPGSRDDLQRRLDHLAHGHPSSPYDHSGSARPPVTDLRRYELPDPAQPESPERPLARPDRPRPLTDAEHRDHITDIRQRLEKAHADGLATDQRHTIDPAREVWSDERDALHDSIIEDLRAKSAGVPCEHKAILAGGLGGAGKSTVLAAHAGIDQSQYMKINPDDIKEELARRDRVPHVAGLSPMEASVLVHDESSYLARQLALRAQADGKNVIWDITMSSRASTEERIAELRSSGYAHIEGVFVDIPVEASVARADARHRHGHENYRAGEGLGGRFVPEDVIRGQADQAWGSQNRKTFEAVKSKFDAWSLFDNSVDGSAPLVVDVNPPEDRMK
jgi:predicted kinase